MKENSGVSTASSSQITRLLLRYSFNIRSLRGATVGRRVGPSSSWRRWRWRLRVVAQRYLGCMRLPNDILILMLLRLFLVRIRSSFRRNGK